MKEGIIVNEDDMSSLWDYGIRKKLNVQDDLKDKKILLTKVPFNLTEKKRMAQINKTKLLWIKHRNTS